MRGEKRRGEAVVCKVGQPAYMSACVQEGDVRGGEGTAVDVA